MNRQSHPQAAPQNASCPLPPGVVGRDMAAERIVIASPLEATRLRPSSVLAYTDAAQARLDARGLVVTTGRSEHELLTEIAEELLDVAGWATVLSYSHPARSPTSSAAVNRALPLAARAWLAIEQARCPR